MTTVRSVGCNRCGLRGEKTRNPGVRGRWSYRPESGGVLVEDGLDGLLEREDGRDMGFVIREERRPEERRNRPEIVGVEDEVESMLARGDVGPLNGDTEFIGPLLDACNPVPGLVFVLLRAQQ